MDSATTSRKRLEYAKVCVEIAIDTCIPSTIEVLLRDGTSAFVEVDVPWLPSSCSKCKIFGHHDKYCPFNVAKPTQHKVAKVWKEKKSIVSTSVAASGDLVLNLEQGSTDSVQGEENKTVAQAVFVQGGLNQSGTVQQGSILNQAEGDL
ncbi:hypothetical protein HRI_001772500 [Hibiscus trionum]|uniref:DUF4283 domain-containing protein n=1 Tax=Hibiscus trionum TaxID=183268 RepID=A0A9W7LX33_HIBTR|nr:hypothetical protein HRI_001772500 [Hibiscus trionum]